MMWLIPIVWLLSLLQFSRADRFIEATSLLTCMENSQFTASFFEIMFFPGNNTARFHVSAISTIDSKTVGANVNLIAYGLNVLQRNISFCDIDYDDSKQDNNPLCPMSSGHLEVDSSYTVSKDVTNQVPGVAYTIPDLDARVRVIIYDIESQQQLACVEATLSNGKTVATKYASWPIAAVAGLGVITSGVISVIGHSNTAAHIASNSMSLFIYFQSLVITAMMAVARVPPIAAAWAQNFVWSMGIVRAGFVQDIANWYVQSTGGSPTDILTSGYVSVSVQRFVKRAAQQLWTQMVKFTSIPLKDLVKRASVTLDTFGATSDSLDPELYSTNEKDDLSGKILVLRGIQRVSYLAGIEITSLFMTAMIFLFFFAFLMIVCLMLFKAIIEILIRSKVMNEGKFNEYRQQWASIIKGTLYRLFVLALPQITVLCLWELTTRDSAATVIVAIFLFVITLLLLLQGAIRVFLKGRESVREFKNPAYLLYGDGKFLNRFGFLYVQYRADCYYFILGSLTYIVLKGLFVALLQSQGMAQAVIVFVIELAYLVIVCWIRPFMDKRTNAFNITIGVINTINALFFMFFSNVFRQPQVVSSVMAVVYFVLNAVFALFLLIFTIVTCVLALLYKNPDTRYQPMKDDRVSFLPRFGKPDDGNAGLANQNEDMELMALGATAMKGHEHGGNVDGKRGNNFDSGSPLDDELTMLGQNQNVSRVYSERSYDRIEPIEPNSTIGGNPYNVQRGYTAASTYSGSISTDRQTPVQNPFGDSAGQSYSNSRNGSRVNFI